MIGRIKTVLDESRFNNFMEDIELSYDNIINQYNLIKSGNRQVSDRKIKRLSSDLRKITNEYWEIFKKPIISPTTLLLDDFISKAELKRILNGKDKSLEIEFMKKKGGGPGIQKEHPTSIKTFVCHLYLHYLKNNIISDNINDFITFLYNTAWYMFLTAKENQDVRGVPSLDNWKEDIAEKYNKSGIVQLLHFKPTEDPLMFEFQGTITPEKLYDVPGPLEDIS